MMHGVPTRLLMTADAVGGVWQYATDLAGALAREGFETLLAVMGPAPDAGQRAVLRDIDGVRLIETGLPLDWLGGPDAAREAANGLAQLAADEGAHIVHLNSPALAAEARFGVPVLGAVHGCVSTWWEAARPEEPLAPELAWHRALTAQGLRRCDRLVAPSAAYAALVQKHYGLTVPPRVVYNGRTPPPPAAVPQDEPVTRAFTAGRLWDAVKATPVLDAVAARLSVPFEAAGPLVAPHGEAACVRHLRAAGPLGGEALAARLARRPVFVSAATFEPFGLAVLEAAAHGCALVLSDIPTFRELWGDVAAFVPCGDDEGFARAIGGLIDDPALRLRRGEAARQRAAGFTPAAAARAMARHYHALAGAPALRSEIAA